MLMDGLALARRCDPARAGACAVIFLMAGLLLGMPTRAAEDLLEGDDVGGIVTDQTITFIGRAFYQGFVRAWQEPPEVGTVNLTVHERPSARWGSLIWVEYRGETIFKTFLFPARKDADVVGARAAVQVASVIEQLRLQRLMSRDPDMAVNELWESE